MSLFLCKTLKQQMQLFLQSFFFQMLEYLGHFLFPLDIFVKCDKPYGPLDVLYLF